MYLYFVRHGQPDYYLDLLTKEGRRQAEVVSQFLAGENIDMFFVSPLGRAKETAKRTLEKVDKVPKIMDWMSELYLLPYHMKKDENGNDQWVFWAKEYLEKFRIYKDDPKWYEDEFLAAAGIKTGTDIEDGHVDELLKSIGISHDREKNIYTKTGDNVPEKICVFAHGGMAIPFLASFLCETYPHFVMTHPCMDTCGLTILKIEFDRENGCSEECFNKILY